MTSFFSESVARHEANAAKWDDQGLPSYADGSRRKAAKWRRREREFAMMGHGAYPKTPLDQLLDDHMSSVVASISRDFESMLING